MAVNRFILWTPWTSRSIVIHAIVDEILQSGPWKHSFRLLFDHPAALLASLEAEQVGHMMKLSSRTHIVSASKLSRAAKTVPAVSTSFFRFRHVAETVTKHKVYDEYAWFLWFLGVSLTESKPPFLLAGAAGRWSGLIRGVVPSVVRSGHQKHFGYG